MLHEFSPAASPVGALPEGLLTLGQLLSLVVIYIASKIGGELPEVSNQRSLGNWSLV